MTLYELTAEYFSLMEILSEEENANTVEEKIEALRRIEADFEKKADGYAKIYRTMQAEAEAIKEEEIRLKKRREAVENGAERLKNALYNAMVSLDKKKFKTALFSFSIQNNRPGVDDYAPEKIPSEYWIPQAPILDKKKLLDDLKDGEIIEGAAIKQGEGLRIR
jgi:hypothetical protein